MTNISKADLLNQLVEAGRESVVTFKEVKNAYFKERTDASGLNLSASLAISIIGGVLLVLGIVFFASIFWDSFGPVMQVLITLGISFVLVLSSLALMYSTKGRVLAKVLFVLGNILLPFGIGVTLEVFDVFTSYEDYVEEILLVIASVIGLGYFVVLWVLRSNLILIASSTALTFAYFFLAMSILGPDFKHYDGVAMIAGFSHIIITYALNNTFYEKTGQYFLSWIGTLLFLGAGYSYVSEEGIGWDLLFIPILLMVTTFSILLQNKTMLVFVTLFLIAYIFFINTEYFPSVITGPISFICSGLVLLAAGYGIVKVDLESLQKKIFGMLK